MNLKLKLYIKYFARKIRDMLGEKLVDFEKINPEEALRKTLIIASKKIPFYKNIKFNPDADNIYEELLKFPVINKYNLLHQRELFYPKKKPWFIVGKTSGTTGTPLEIYRSFKSIIYESAFIRRHWSQVGFKTGMKRATLRGDYVVPVTQTKPPFWFYNIFDNQLIISSRHLKDEYFEIIADKLEEFSPYILEAYPSTAYELALYLERVNRYIKIPYVFTSSEILYEHQRKLIEKRFCAKVRDFYGMAERVAFATECEYGNLHVNTDYSYVEILDENGNPTDDYGFITGTTYHNEVMPLIRYQLSDITRWKKGTCPCGSKFPMIEPIQGKLGDMLYDVKGNAISPAIIGSIFRDAHYIKKSQVAQIDKEVWEIRIVPTSKFDVNEMEKLVNKFKKMIDPSLKIKVKIVKDIPRTKAGKFKRVVNEWKKEQGF